tara:strand:- start:2662 stop:3792 length:1131 start_codon:yes stop_codon:yes gene_type:complete
MTTVSAATSAPPTPAGVVSENRDKFGFKPPPSPRFSFLHKKQKYAAPNRFPLQRNPVKPWSTTVFRLREGHHYPIKDTEKTALLVKLGEDECEILVMSENGVYLDKPQQTEKCEPRMLQTVLDYAQVSSELDEKPQSTFPLLATITTSAQSAKAYRCTRQSPHLSIVVFDPSHASRTMSDFEILALVTMKEKSNCLLRNFKTVEDLKQSWFRQGSSNPGQHMQLTCGVEAARNAGFIDVQPEDFHCMSEDKNETGSFRVEGSEHSSKHVSFLDCKNGNMISINIMHPVIMQQIKENGHHGDKDIQLESDFLQEKLNPAEAEFWVQRKFAILLIKMRGCNHWISLEKILFGDEEVLCLRDGLGVGAVTDTRNNKRKR